MLEPSRVLGAVLAGGLSSRFGSDKALALVSNRRLIDGVIAALQPQVAAVVICGREWPDGLGLEDRPAAGMGPLGGLCAALLEAQRRGLDAVLCAPCDAIGLPVDLLARLSPGPAIAAGQRSVGLWPAAYGQSLLARLAAGGDRSIRGWATACNAREVDCGVLGNVNRPADLPLC